MYFEYGETETGYLKKKDKRLGEAIERIGHIDRTVHADLFEALVTSIIGQQISGVAQRTVCGRLEDRIGTITPAAINSLSRDELKRLGISYRKADYIQGLAASVQSGALDTGRLYDLPDDEVISELSSLKGIGSWTAEMIMIFCMQRPDILSYGDFGIRKGMRMLYRHKELTAERFKRYRKRYSPYGTVAGLYLWAIAGGAIPELNDPGEKQTGNRK